MLSHVQLFATPWTSACQAPLSMGFSMQDYWSGFPFHTPGDLPDLGTESMSPVSPSLVGGFISILPPGKPHSGYSGGHIDLQCGYRCLHNKSVL